MRIASIILLFLALSARNCSQQPSPGGPDAGGETAQTAADLRYAPVNLRPVLERQQQAAFRFFYDGAEPLSGMALEGNNRGSTITIGGSGFGLMALVVGMERGWITRDQGLERVGRILSFLEGAERYRGVWSHWYNPDGSYAPFGDQEATGDLVETSLLVQGLLVMREYLKPSAAGENALRGRIDALCADIHWADYTGPDGDGLYWLWYSRKDAYVLKIKGWNEALLTWLLALGAPAHAVSPALYEAAWSTPVYPERQVYGYALPLGSSEMGGPLFFSHYSFLGFDPRHMADDKAWYWRQNLSHTLVNRHYCVYEAPAERGYGEECWGLTACYGAGSSPHYAARHPGHDDGVIAPTAALSAFPYTPFYSAQVLLAFDTMAACQGTYGLADAYHVADRAANTDHLAIDQGPIVAMIENYRSGLLWDLFMQNEWARRSLQRAGMAEPRLAEGFPYVAADSRTGLTDLVAHPDRERYELDFYSAKPGSVQAVITAAADYSTVKQSSFSVPAGVSRFSFDDSGIVRGQKYYISLTLPSGKAIHLESVLH